jgi:purine-binding chemotaxis protein CheW
VSEVLEIPASEIEPTPAFGAKIRADFIAGMGKVNGKLVIILSVDKVLSVDELAILEHAAGVDVPLLSEQHVYQVRRVE